MIGLTSHHWGFAKTIDCPVLQGLILSGLRQSKNPAINNSFQNCEKYELIVYWIRIPNSFGFSSEQNWKWSADETTYNIKDSMAYALVSI